MHLKFCLYSVLDLFSVVKHLSFPGSCAEMCAGVFSGVCCVLGGEEVLVSRCGEVHHGGFSYLSGLLLPGRLWRKNRSFFRQVRAEQNTYDALINSSHWHKYISFVIGVCFHLLWMLNWSWTDLHSVLFYQGSGWQFLTFCSCLSGRRSSTCLESNQQHCGFLFWRRRPSSCEICSLDFRGS